MSLSRIQRIEQLVDSYVAAWLPRRQRYSGIYEDFGDDEKLLLCNNAITPDLLNHSEISHLVPLLTRQLRAIINKDHKLLWAWCAQVISTLRYRNTSSNLLNDSDWSNAFISLIHLVLTKPAQAGTNFHLSQVADNKHVIAPPLAYALLEGALRRKSDHFVDKSGNVLRAFNVTDAQQQTKPYDTRNNARIKTRINSLADTFRLFEQVAIPHRGRICVGLDEIKREITNLHQIQNDVYDEMGSWRNSGQHGSEFWHNRLPVLTNMLCLLLLDEFESSEYDKHLPMLVEKSNLYVQRRALHSSRVPWDIYPPDP